MSFYHPTHFPIFGLIPILGFKMLIFGLCLILLLFFLNCQLVLAFKDKLCLLWSNHVGVKTKLFD